MRKFLAIVLLVIVGAAGSLVLLNRAPRAPLDLEVVSSRPLDKMNGKEFILVTLAIKNRTRDAVIFDKIDDIQAMVRGDWIEVDQSFTVPIQVADKDDLRLVAAIRAGAERMAGAMAPPSEEIAGNAEDLRNWLSDYRSLWQGLGSDWNTKFAAAMLLHVVTSYDQGTDV